MGDWRGFGDGAVIEAAAHMRPAEGEADVAPLSQGTVASVAIDLKDAPEARKMHDRLRRRPVGRIDIGDSRRVRSAPGTVVSRIGPKLPGLRPPSAGIEHRRRRLVGK